MTERSEMTEAVWANADTTYNDAEFLVALAADIHNGALDWNVGTRASWGLRLSSIARKLGQPIRSGINGTAVDA